MCISFIAKCLMLNDSSMNGTSNHIMHSIQHTKNDLNREKYQNNFLILYKIVLNNNNNNNNNIFSLNSAKE